MPTCSTLLHAPQLIGLELNPPPHPHAGLVFLQSDILQAAEGMRDAIEEAASDAFEPAPQHADPSAVFFAKSHGLAVVKPSSGGSSSGSTQAAAAAGGDSSSPSTDTAAAAGAATETAGGGDEDGSWQPNWVKSDGDDSEDEGPLFVSEWAKAGWLKDNPVGVPTEREYYVASTQGAEVYRILLVKR